jgi:hypothetical protein
MSGSVKENAEGSSFKSCEMRPRMTSGDAGVPGNARASTGYSAHVVGSTVTGGEPPAPAPAAPKLDPPLAVKPPLEMEPPLARAPVLEPEALERAPPFARPLVLEVEPPEPPELADRPPESDWSADKPPEGPPPSSGAAPPRATSPMS